jgi:hypothetical protein
MVLEYEKDTEVVDDAQPKEEFGPPLVRRIHKEPEAVIQYRAQHKECQEFPAPPSIEEIAGSDQEGVLQSEASVEDKPIEYEHQREEKEVFEGVEKHADWSFAAKIDYQNVSSETPIEL